MGVEDRYKKKKEEESKSNTLYNGVENRYLSQGIETIGKDIENRINTWLTNNKNYIDNAQYRFSDKNTSYRADSSDWLTTVTKQRENFGLEADSIKKVLTTYKDFFGEEYVSSVFKALDENLKIQDSVIEASTNDRDHWSQWDSYDAWKKDYDAAIAWQKDYDEKMSYDLTAGKTEIDRLNNILGVKDEITKLKNDIAILNQVKSDPYGTHRKEKEEKIKRLEAMEATWAHAMQVYGSEDALRAMASEKGAYYTLAQRVQEGAKLGGVSDPNSEYYDPNFAKYSSIGNTVSWENVGDKTNKNGIAIYDDLKAATLVMNERLLGKELYSENMVTPKEGILGYFEGLKGLSEYNTENTETVNIFREMEDSEVSTLAYYLQKDKENGTNLAEQYVASLRETLNGRVAKKIAESKETDFSKYLFAVEAGIDQFFEGRDALFSGADYIPPSATQQASGIIRENLEDTGIPMWYNFATGQWENQILGSSTGQIFYDSLNTTANMLPSVLASTLTSLVNPALGGWVGSAALGMSAAGNAKAEMLNLGYSKSQANAYGIMVGASEVLLEKFLGGIPGISNGDGIFSSLGEKILGKIDNAFARAAITIGGNMLDEGLEEGLQTILEPWLKEVATSVDFDAPNIDEVLYSSLLGALSSIGFGAADVVGGKINSNIQTNKYGQSIIDNGSVDSLKQLALEMYTDKSIAEQKKGIKLSEKVDKNASAKNVGKLATYMESTVESKNEASLTSALTQKGLSAKVASKVAKYILNSGELSETERNIIEGSKRVQKAINEVREIPSRLQDAVGTRQRAVKEIAERLAVAQTEADIESEAGAKFEASDNGKTVFIDAQGNARDVTIKKIASTEGGLKLELEGGITVNASDLKFGTKEETLMYEMVARMEVTPETANEIIGSFKPSNVGQASRYFSTVPLAYRYGQMGYEAGLKNVALPDNLKKIAYNRGRMDAIAQDKSKTKTTNNVSSKASTKKGGIIFENGYVYDESKANDVQKASMASIEVIEKMSNLEVHVFESYVNKKGERVYKVNGVEKPAPNGYYIEGGNKIYIDINAGNKGEGAMNYAMAHEIGHYIREWNAKGFRELGDFLLKEYGKQGVPVEALLRDQKEKIKKRYERNNETLPSEAKLNDMAYEELVCDAMSEMLADERAYEKLAKLKQQNRTLWQKLGEAIKALLDKLKGTLGIYSKYTPDAQEASFVRRFDKKTFEKLQDLYLKAFVEADANYEAAQQFSTDNIRGNAEGAVAKSEVTDALVNSIAKGEVLLSERTEYEALPKQTMSLSTGVGTLLEFIEGLTPTKVNGLTDKGINGYTGRDVRMFAMKNNGFTKAQIAEVNKFMDSMSDFMKEAGVTYRFIGLQDVENAQLHYSYHPDGKIKSIVLSAMVKNGDYPVNFDLSSICKKREAMSALIRKLAKRGTIDNGTVKLTPTNIFKINTALKDAGYETACLGCFVESKRYNSLEWAKKFCDKWNAAVKKVNPNATYFGYGNATFNEDSFTVEQAIKIDEAANKYIKATKTERLANALAKYKAKEQAGQPLVAGKVMKVDGKELYTFSKAARDRLMKSDTISDELKTKYLTCDVSTLNIADVEFLLENGVLAGASLSNKQAVTEMVKSGEAYQHLLRPSDLLTDRGISKLEALPNFHGVLYGHYGSGTPKLMQSYTPYNSEIALLPTHKNSEQTLAEYLYSIAGVRMQSFSDFQIQNIYDYLQMVADLAARKVPAHAYTKEISFAKLLGMTGIKVNLSVMFDIDPMVDKAHAGLIKLNPLIHKGEYAKVVLEDSQGKWVYNIGDYQTQKMFAEAFPDEAKRFLQSIGFADAVKLQSSKGYSSNCGIIGVGYSDLGIFAMLDDNRIRYIIPYHASSLPADIKVATNIELGTDYTPYQNTMKIEGIVDRNGNKVNWTIKEAYKRLGSGQAVIDELNNNIRNKGWVVTTKKAQTGHGTYGLYEDLQQTNDPRQTASNFMDWCIGNSTLPLFYQFASHNNYYKLLYDYNVYDCVTEEYAPQQAVTNTYPTMVDGQVQPSNVTDGGFNTEFLQETIDKQMKFMDEYSRDLDADLDKLADNMEKGNYSLQESLKDKFKPSDRDSYSDRASEVIDSLYNYDTVKFDKRVVDWNTEDFKAKWAKGYYTSVVDTIAKHTGKSNKDVWNAFADILLKTDGIAKVDGKTYINVHELSEENLRKAFDLGGLASPSIGIVDVDSPVTRFGSISLIFPDIFNPETVPTYYGDSYSTSLPAVAKFTDKTSLEDALTFGYEGMEYSGILSSEEAYDLIRDLEQIYFYDETQRTSHNISENGFRDAKEFARNYSVKSIDGLRKLYDGLSDKYNSYEQFLEDFADKVFTKKRLHRDHTANPDFDWNDRAYKFRDYTLDDAVAEMTARGDDDFKLATGEKAKGYDELLSKGMRARLKASSTGFYEVKPQRAVYIGEATYAVVPYSTSADIIEMLESEGVEVVKYQPKEGYTGAADGRAEAIKGILERDTANIRYSDRDSSYSEIDKWFESLSIEELEQLMSDNSSINDISEEINVEPEKIEILFYREGLGNSYVEDGRKAVMTQSRIDEAIEYNGASNPAYARRLITRISPSDFIDLTVKRENQNRTVFDSKVQGDHGNTMGNYDYESALKDSRANPYLVIDVPTGRVIGHNGRHRMRAMELLGINSVEIEVELYDEGIVKTHKGIIKDLAISSQFDTKTQTRLSNLIPLNESYRVEIEKTYGEKAHSNAKVKYSERDPNSVSNRSLLAGALESVAQNDIEKKKLDEYKAKIALIESEQKKLGEIRAKANELRFTKGRTSAETKQMKDLDFEATQIANRINTYDKQLLNLESTKALKNVLDREKANLRKRLEQKGKQALKDQKQKDAQTIRELMNRHTESRKKAIEGRHKTEVRNKIKKVVSDLNKLLLNPTKEQHVPIGLQLPVAEALDAINMDTMNAEERVAYYNDLISKSSDPDEIAMLTKKRDFFEYRDANFKERIAALKTAYAEFKESDDPLIRNAHNEAIEDLIKNTADAVGNKSLKDMSYEQLEAVYRMYKAILATVRNANKMFKEGIQETITQNSEDVKVQVKEVGGHQDRVLKLSKFFKKFGWDMLKPVTAMKVIGSKTFEKLFDNVRAGEDTWAVDVGEAKQFYDDVAKKYNFSKWDFKKKYTFKDNNGDDFSISLEQIMSLYAYSKRDQADKHLEFGGFIFDDAIEVTEKKLGIPLKYEVNDANPHRLRMEDVLAIAETLTQEQKAFVDEMQTYLSNVMGAKGNEVSLAMYDIKLYTEKNYFPLKTSRYFREFDPEKSGTPRIKNSGFSKKTVPQAGNPIVLSNFMDVWAGHVNDMSMYHAFVLPLEDFMRVYNYSSTAGGYDSVQQYIKNAYGAQANQYIERLMDDLNGGARVDSSAGVINKGLSLFKKASVFASASVVVQQPSAIARALAYINPKYFVTSTASAMNVAKHNKVWAEVKKYAPVAVIKEMGYFDTGMGRSTVEWIKGDQTWKDKMDDALSKAPALADELVWCHIWEAVKKETADTKKIKAGTEDFYEECGRRFTEVITNTQVYDSVLSRSGMMRSKDTGMKMATAFMAEPTTTVNMMVDGIIQGKRGNKKFTAATVGAVASSIILNSILVALVYAARDDDEDETYAEKYIGSVTSELLDGFNPLTYVPFVKDIWSIAQGYDVERSDMSVVSKLWESVEGLFKEDKSGLEKVLDFTGSVSSLFGIPLKNLIRDAKGMYNLTLTLTSGTQTTGAGITEVIEDSFKSSIPLWDRLTEGKSNADRLYEAILSGDKVQIERIKSRYKDEKAIESAMRQALRENDSRIKEAAKAKYEGDISEYTRIAKMIIAEGKFSQDTIVAAINAELNAIKKGETVEVEETEDNDEVTSIYSSSDINAAFDNGDTEMALEIINDLIETKVANGMEEKNARSSIKSSMTSYWKPLYKEAYKNGDTQEMYRIRTILLSSGLYGKTSDVIKTAKDWLKS